MSFECIQELSISMTGENNNCDKISWLVVCFGKRSKKVVTCQFDNLRDTLAVCFMFPPVLFLAISTTVENPFAAKTSLQSAFL